jgi:oligogalacturonide lyase
MRRLILLLLAAGTASCGLLAAAEPPAEWIDPDTGHRIVRLSIEPDSASLYFFANACTPKGDRLVFDTPDGIAAVDLTRLGNSALAVDMVAPGFKALAVGRQSPDVYFPRAGALWAADVYTHAARQLLPSRATAVNCDGSIAVQVINATDPSGRVQPPPPRVLMPQRERMFGDKIKAKIALTPEEEAAARREDQLSRDLAAPACQAFVFTDLKTGISTTNGYQYAWLNNLQFSPTDPHLLLYCHEGSWHEVDRIWTIRTDGSEQRLMHRRTMDMEIAGHEFWSADGRTIWFDLQTPRSREFWLAGLNLDSGNETRYHLERDWWSAHYNVSPDGKLFAGDGAGPGEVSFSGDAQWINLFRVQPDGTLSREKLADLSRNRYQHLDPNVRFTPDGKWVVFRSNMFGPTHVFAVEVAKAPTTIPKPPTARPELPPF